MRVGRVNILPVMAVNDLGVLLGTRADHVLMLPHEAPDGVKKGDMLRVFIYTDTHDERAATMDDPIGVEGEIVPLRIVDISHVGAFADWGLEKDLLIPWKLQHTRLEKGDRVVVAITLDEHTGRCLGSTWLAKYLERDPRGYQPGQEVDFVTYGVNEYGVLGVVDKHCSALIPRTEFDRRPTTGNHLNAFVQRIRPDGRIDCSLKVGGQAGRDNDQETVLAAIARGNGRLDITDKSPPDLIRDRLGMSKKSFKRAVGSLYKNRIVTLSDGYIALKED